MRRGLSRLRGARQKYALYFDGVDDYVIVPLSGYYEVVIETFMKPILQPTDERTFLFYFTNPSSLDIVYDPRYDPNVIRGYPKGSLSGTTLAIPYTLTEEWQYITMYWKWGGTDNKFKLWVNTTYIGEATSTTNIGTPVAYTEYKIAKSYDYPYKGYIAFIRIYNRALSDSEILHNYYNPDNPITNGLVLWLHWDSIDDVNGKWVDKSGYGNDGVIYGARKVFI